MSPNLGPCSLGTGIGSGGIDGGGGGGGACIGGSLLGLSRRLLVFLRLLYRVVISESKIISRVLE